MRMTGLWLLTLTALALRPASAQTVSDSSLVMSDGVHIETTLTLPTVPPSLAGFPAVIFIHGLGGDKDDDKIRLIGEVLSARGFACLTYSVRGQGRSGGLSTIMGPREVQDLREVVTFLRSRPGVNPEALGIAGGSQGGVHAWIAAIHRLPGIKCIATLLAPPSYAADLAPNNCVKQQLEAELSLGSVRFDPLRDRIRSFVLTENLDSIHTFIAQRNLEPMLDSVTIPVIQSLGWDDIIFPANGSIRARAQLANRGVPIWSYFGTNGHGVAPNFPEYLFVVGMMLDWFDHWLKTPFLPDALVPKVIYADDRPAWPHHETETWPPVPASTVRLYLGGERYGGGGFLQSIPPIQSTTYPFSLTYDPSYTPEQGWNESYRGAPFHNAFRETSVRFLSVPLGDTLDVTGIPMARLMLRGDGGPFQAHVRLFDVEPVDTGSVWHLMTHLPLGIRGPGTSADALYGAEGEALSHRVPPYHHLGIEITSLDMWDQDRAHIIPYFRSSNSILTAAPLDFSYIDIPVTGNVRFVTSVPTPLASVPAAVTLHPNFPNPFNPATTIRFDLAAAQQVRLDVFSMSGQQVATLVDGFMPAGTHTIPFNARNLASGVYVCRLLTQGGSSQRSMVLLR
jgi:predicted acyl esterase